MTCCNMRTWMVRFSIKPYYFSLIVILVFVLSINTSALSQRKPLEEPKKAKLLLEHIPKGLIIDNEQRISKIANYRKRLETDSMYARIRINNFLEEKIDDTKERKIVALYSDNLNGRLVVFDSVSDTNLHTQWVSPENIVGWLGSVEAREINKDGKTEFIVHIATGAHGMGIYLYTWDGKSARLLPPNGGGSGDYYFSDHLVLSVEDVDGDSIDEIYVGYRDYDHLFYRYTRVYYKWNGKDYMQWKEEVWDKGKVISEKYY